MDKFSLVYKSLTHVMKKMIHSTGPCSTPPLKERKGRKRRRGCCKKKEEEKKQGNEKTEIKENMS